MAGTCGVGRSGQDRTVEIKERDLIIRAGTMHCCHNGGNVPARTFNFYSPPEYPTRAKGRGELPGGWRG